MFKKNHTKFAEVLGGAVSVDDFTPESLKFLRDVKEQQDKADAQEWEEVKQQAAREFEYSGDHRRALEIMNCDEKVLNDRELFRAGTLDDYNMWLLDYLKQGGKITHYYDYNFQRRYWRVVNNTQKRVFLKNPRYLQLIIPKRHSFEDLHTQYDRGPATHIYGWENGKAITSGRIVPAYADTIDKQILDIAHRVLGAPRY